MVGVVNIGVISDDIEMSDIGEGANEDHIGQEEVQVL